MEPASTIIRLLGGASRVSTIAGVHRVSVAKWKMPKDRGGTGGTVPMRHVSALLAYARKNGIAISADDFIPAISPKRKAS